MSNTESGSFGHVPSEIVGLRQVIADLGSKLTAARSALERIAHGSDPKMSDLRRIAHAAIAAPATETREEHIARMGTPFHSICSECPAPQAEKSELRKPAEATYIAVMRTATSNTGINAILAALSRARSEGLEAVARYYDSRLRDDGDPWFTATEIASHIRSMIAAPEAQP